MDGSQRAAVSFSDVAALFSEGEWDVLEQRQRDLYGNVMREIHHVLLGLGYRIENSEVLFRIISEEETPKRRHFQEGLGPDIMLRINDQGPAAGSEDSDPRTDLLPKIKQEEDICDTGAPDPIQGQDGRPCSTPGLVLDSLYPMTIKKETEDGGGAFQLSEPASEWPVSKIRPPCRSLSSGEAALEQTCGDRTSRGIARQIKSVAALHNCDQNQQTEPKEKEAPRHPRQEREAPRHPRQEREAPRHPRQERHAGYPISFQRGQNFICGVCGKTSCSNSNLQVHMRTHTGERPYKCSHCDKSFIRTSHLKVHLRTHTGERPYKCPECDKSFRDDSSFAWHQRTHTGEKPYQCATCGKYFRKKSNLKVHQRTHTGERPYKCKHCDKGFHQRSNLRVHERKHHQDSGARQSSA